MELETALGKGRSAGAKEASSFLTKDYRNPAQTRVQSGAVLQSLWKEAVPGLHLLL